MTAPDSLRRHDRLAELDGLRGIAALIVAVHHFVAAFEPTLFFGRPDGIALSSASFIAETPAYAFINGSFAVYVFFVLSGYVLAAQASNITWGVRQFAAAVASRIIRLGVPSSCGVVIGAGLIAMGLIHLHAAADLVGHRWIVSHYAPESFTVERFAFEALGGYFAGSDPVFNPVLWTMKRELIGSIAIYLVFATARSRSARAWVYPLAAIGLVALNIEPQSFLCFLAGAAMFDWIRRGTSAEWLAVFLLALGLVAAGRPWNPPPDGSFYDGLLGGLRSLAPFAAGNLWTVGAVLIVLAVLMSRGVRSIFSKAPCVFLGRISFALYLVHFPLLASSVAASYVALGAPSGLALFGLLLAYLGLLIPLSVLFERLVDAPALRLSRRVRRFGHGQAEGDRAMQPASGDGAAPTSPSPRWRR